MGLLDWFGTSKSTQQQQQQQTSTQNVDLKETQKQTQSNEANKNTSSKAVGTVEQEKVGTQSGTQKTTQSLFDADSLATLSGVIKGLSDKVSSGDPSLYLDAVVNQAGINDPAILALLTNRAQGFGANREQVKADMSAAAVQNFDDTTARTVAQNQQQVGSGAEFNSASKLMELDAKRKLSVDLAALSANTDMAFDKEEGIALLQALQGSAMAAGTANATANTPVAQLLQALAVARGGTVTSETQAAQQTSESAAQKSTQQQQIEEIAKALAELTGESTKTGTIKTDSSGTGSGSGTQTGSPLDMLNSLSQSTANFGKAFSSFIPSGGG